MRIHNTTPGSYACEILKWHPYVSSVIPRGVHRALVRTRINAAYEYLSELLEQGLLPRSCFSDQHRHASHPPQAYRTQHTYNRKPFTPGFSDPNVFEVFVKSSHIVSIGYDRIQGILYIKFEGDRVYAYLPS